MGSPKYTPTKETIAKISAEIREEWNDAEYIKRCRLGIPLPKTVYKLFLSREELERGKDG